MARIQGVPQNQAGPIVRLAYRFMRKGMRKMTGREADDGLAKVTANDTGRG